MVTEVKNSDEVAIRNDPPPAVEDKPASLPPGKYTLVGWDMDTTGWRLIDEICQIVGYTPNETYSQYIMPYGDLNPGARRRHKVRVVTVGRYRMLKDTITHKVLKTKSEIAALTDFLDWLEKVKGDCKVILICHEPRRLSPTMLLEALTKCKLLDRFKTIVAGFTNSYSLAMEKCKWTVKSVSLRVLTRVLLDSDIPVNNALERAGSAYKIVEHLAQSEEQEVGAGGEGGASGDVSPSMVNTVRTWARSVDAELAALASLKTILERQNSFRPVFAPLLRTARPARKRATQLRRLLADAGLLYDQLKDAWTEDKTAGLEKQLSGLTKFSAVEDDIKMIVEIFDCHFDTTKDPMLPFMHLNVKQKVPTLGAAARAASSADGTSTDSATSSPQNTPNKTVNVAGNQSEQAEEPTTADN